jgi:ribulose-bisphosphate carboxylase large chain
LARLAGASGIHTGTAGVGKMAGSSDEDITAAKLALCISSKGHFFDQIWSEVPSNDPDIQKLINDEANFWQQGPRAMSNLRKTNPKIEINSKWRIIKKTCPIISGGLNPVLLPEFIETIGTIDFITTMGAGVHSHPDGTKAGAAAVLQAFEAWQKNIPQEEYAKDHKELADAITFFNKEGTQAHRITDK